MYAKALQALAERIVAGEPEIEVTPEMVGPDLFAIMGTISETRGALTKSLDACDALHDVVLGGDWEGGVEWGLDGAVAWVRSPKAHSDLDIVSATASTPARAWLAAILRAHAANLENGNAQPAAVNALENANENNGDL